MRANEYRRRYPEKAKAHNAVATAVRWGRLKPPDCCEVCKLASKVHGHHEDYSRPLEVIWVCPDCHKGLHHPHRLPKRHIPPPYKPHHKKYQPAPKRDKLLDKAKRLRQSGKSYRCIAVELGVTAATVFKWLNDTRY